MAILMLQTEALLLAVGQDPETSKNAGTYVTASIPAFILSGLIDNQRTFLNMVGQSKVPMICQGVGIGLHGAFCYVFIKVMELEIQGVALAWAASNAIILVSLHIYTFRVPEIKGALVCPSKDVFKNLGEFLKLSVPCILSIASEFWAWEIMNLIVGYVGVNE